MAIKFCPGHILFFIASKFLNFFNISLNKIKKKQKKKKKKKNIKKKKKNLKYHWKYNWFINMKVDSDVRGHKRGEFCLSSKETESGENINVSVR